MEQLFLFDLEPPPEAFCPICGKKLKKRRDGVRYHARDDGRLCEEIYLQRVISFAHRKRLPSPSPVQSNSDEAQKKSA